MSPHLVYVMFLLALLCSPAVYVGARFFCSARNALSFTIGVLAKATAVLLVLGFFAAVLDPPQSMQGAARGGVDHRAATPAVNAGL